MADIGTFASLALATAAIGKAVLVDRDTVTITGGSGKSTYTAIGSSWTPPLADPAPPVVAPAGPAAPAGAWTSKADFAEGKSSFGITY